MTTNTDGRPNAGALSHLRVLDLTHARAGPTAVRVLADHGAEVIQISRVDGGGIDDSLPSFDKQNLHRNKRSIGLDLRTDAGRTVFYRLVSGADVVVENFRAEVKHRLAIDYDTLRRINKRIVYGSISGFGQDGPYAGRPGVDQIAQGLGGLMSVTGTPGSRPLRVGIPVADLCAGLYLAHGLMAAIIERDRSGEGQWVHTSLLEAMIAMLDFQATRWLIANEVPQQVGNDHPTSYPTGDFKAADGIVNIAASGDKVFRDLLDAIGASALADDDRFTSVRNRVRHRDELHELLEDNLAAFTVRELIETLNAAGVPCGPILTIDQVFADPQVEHLAMAQTVESETHGALTLVRSPTNLSRTMTSMRLAAPSPGAHTAEILAEIGYSYEEIASLVSTGVVARSGSRRAEDTMTTDETRGA